MAEIGTTFDYEAARKNFKLEVPADFNFAFDILTKQAASEDKTALIAVASDGESAEEHSYSSLEKASNQFVENHKCGYMHNSLTHQPAWLPRKKK